jgi:hypothetical protein
MASSPPSTSGHGEAVEWAYSRGITDTEIDRLRE